MARDSTSGERSECFDGPRYGVLDDPGAVVLEEEHVVRLLVEGHVETRHGLPMAEDFEN